MSPLGERGRMPGQLDVKRLRNLGDAARFLVDDLDLRTVPEDAWPYKMAMLAAAIEDAADEIEALREGIRDALHQPDRVMMRAKLTAMMAATAFVREATDGDQR